MFVGEHQDPAGGVRKKRDESAGEGGDVLLVHGAAGRGEAHEAGDAAELDEEERGVSARVTKKT